MSHVLILELQPACQRIAKSFADSYPPCDKDDIEQELMVFLLENQERLPDVWAAAEASEDSNGERVVSRMLRDAATNYCRQERAQIGILHNEYWYRPADVREALKFWFEYEHWLAYIQGKGPEDGKRIYAGRQVAGSAEDGEPRTGQVIWHDDKAEGLTVLTDISRCYESLNEQARQVLEEVHVQELTFVEIGQREGTSDSAVKSRYYRAVDVLTELMNGTR